MATLTRFAKDESATTAIEYCIIASLISIVIIVTVNGLGTSLNGMYQSILNALN